MNGNEFLDKMELVDLRYVQEANQKPKTKAAKTILFRWCAAAACAALVLTAGILSICQNSRQGPLPYFDNIVIPQKDASAAKPFELPTMEEDGMGHEGYMAYSIDELVSGNPWTADMELTSLPVYKNASFNLKMTDVKFSLMEEFLLEIASRLGLDRENLRITDNAAMDEEKQAIIEKHQSIGVDPPPESFFAPSALIAQADGIRIEVDYAMTARIDFEQPEAYPEELTFPEGTANQKDVEKLAEYLAEKYADLLGMEHPAADISGGDYGISGNRYFSLAFYEKDADDTEKILQYNFNRVQFCNDTEGKLFLIRINRPDLTHPLGNYPIISENEARQQLLSGQYVTSVPCDSFEAQDVQKVELIYQHEPNQALYVPYYKYYVDVTEELCAPITEKTGIRQYGIYYVPAVSPEYLEGKPLWDGRIN